MLIGLKHTWLRSSLTPRDQEVSQSSSRCHSTPQTINKSIFIGRFGPSAEPNRSSHERVRHTQYRNPRDLETARATTRIAPNGIALMPGGISRSEDSPCGQLNYPGTRSPNCEVEDEGRRCYGWRSCLFCVPKQASRR